MAQFLLLAAAAYVLAATAAHVAAGQQEGFVSIDCGQDDAAFSGRGDINTGIVYVSDGPYVDGGESHRIKQESSDGGVASLLTLRSFPDGVRNCYSLPTESGSKYLVRMEFLYGNYDGGDGLSLEFDLHLGTNYWDTYQLVQQDAGYWWSEAIFVAWASWVPLCLVNTGRGTPFVNTVELRLLGDSMYPDAAANQSMSSLERRNMGDDTTAIIRFPDDPYDRRWVSRNDSRWQHLATDDSIEPEDSFAVPNLVLRTAVVPVKNGTVVNFMIQEPSKTSSEFLMFLHFADFQNSQLREFDIHINDEALFQYTPQYLNATYVQNSGWSSKTTNNYYNVTLVATDISVLPPMINAYEIYNLIRHETPRTFSKDFDTMMAIKLEYGVKKNWMGDPCFPTTYAWNGVKCSNTTDNITRIISLDLSNSNLNGVISSNFTLLADLQFLDLSGNSLNGSIPDSLCERNGGSLDFRFELNKDMCIKRIFPPPQNRAIIISISVMVSVAVVVVLALLCLVWRRKRQPKILDPRRAPEPHGDPVSIKGNEGHLQNNGSRQFTYSELEKFTNKFERPIGKGGFGLVYYGRLEDNTEVAIKMRSESSSHGLHEFLAEVNSLSKVHHRNLVSLVGYCREKDQLALVYEYMSEGNLCDHVRGKDGFRETLSWLTRVRIVLESAQGLDYLHKGCSLPIIHRDVKTNNILLGQNLRAKIADFGLCKTYLSDMQTHISTNVAGSTGYMDPRYYHTGRLAESSDVYSFGVVLLEVATGEPPTVPGHGHIVQRVKQKIATGNISMVADAQLGGAYDVNSMWKMIDTAMACTSDFADGRPTMAIVVAQLKESLALEESREENIVQGSFTSTRTDSMSTFGPSVR